MREEDVRRRKHPGWISLCVAMESGSDYVNGCIDEEGMVEYGYLAESNNFVTYRA